MLHVSRAAVIAGLAGAAGVTPAAVALAASAGGPASSRGATSAAQNLDVLPFPVRQTRPPRPRSISRVLPRAKSGRSQRWALAADCIRAISAPSRRATGALFIRRTPSALASGSRSRRRCAPRPPAPPVAPKAPEGCAGLLQSRGPQNSDTPKRPRFTTTSAWPPASRTQHHLGTTHPQLRYRAPISRALDLHARKRHRHHLRRHLPRHPELGAAGRSLPQSAR